MNKGSVCWNFFLFAHRSLAAIVRLRMIKSEAERREKFPLLVLRSYIHFLLNN